MFLILVGMNVLATFVNACLCVYFSSKKKFYKHDDQICDIAYILSIWTILCDIVYCVLN